MFFLFGQARILRFFEQPPFLAPNTAWKIIVFLWRNKSINYVYFLNSNYYSTGQGILANHYVSSAHIHTLYPHVISEQNESSERAEPRVSFKTLWLVFGQEIEPVSDTLIYALRPVPVTGNGHSIVLSYPLSLT